MRLLLLSNSTNADEEYLAYSIPYIRDFLSGEKFKGLFIPYAGVTISWDDYYNKVLEKFNPLGIELSSLHNSKDEEKAILEAELIIIGGGNTFHLLKTLQEKSLLNLIQDRVKKGVPYIGWSAGSNITCPTICTTNDMPILEPDSFNSLGLIPFQINPHYTDENFSNHAGETREMRILEFLEVNKSMKVVGLREGTMFRIENNEINLQGIKSCRIFSYGNEPKELNSGDNFSFLTQ